MPEKMNFMAENASIMLHDAQKLVKIERWLRFFAGLVFVIFWLTLLDVGITLINLFIASQTLVGWQERDNIWIKSNYAFTNVRGLIELLVLYFLFLGLSKLIRYLLNLKTLALNRYHARKTSS